VTYDNSDVIGRHLADLHRARYSRSTIKERHRVLRSIPFDLLTLDRVKTQQWWETRQYRLDGNERSASALSQEASHLRRFCRWAMQQDLMERNAGDWLPDVRQTSPAVRPIPEGDLHRAIEAAPEPMRRALALAALAGLRSEEIGAVQWEDIDRGNGVLWVRLGKGSKGRSVPLSSGLLVMLGDPGPDDTHIIGRPMTGKAVSQEISRYLHSQGLDYTAHKLRARYATRFLAATGDLKAAADALGHANLGSISRYVIASSDTMRRGAEAAGRIG
jgi:integrase